MEFLEKIQQAGVVGAGGAGFPTHVKLKAKARWLILNAAECEPLIETDKFLCRNFADRIVAAAVVTAAHLGAEHTVIAIKGKYEAEIRALQAAIDAAGQPIEICKMSTFYPAGDEQTMVQWVTGRSVPERGLPLDVEAVVDNVGTMLTIYDAITEGSGASMKYLSVVGEVPHPVMVHAPIGTPITQCIAAAKPLLEKYAVIVGGPMMGKVLADPQQIEQAVVTKTTGNLLVLPREHYLITRAGRPMERLALQAKTTCIQCRMCTDLCPRFQIGHDVQPHLVMRNLYREQLTDDATEWVRAFGSAANCCSCGICEMFACPMGLSPRKVNEYIKGRMRERGIQVPRNQQPEARDSLNLRRVPTERLIARLDLSRYDGLHASDDCLEIHPDRLFVPFSQHIGKPAQPVCKVGDTVQKGQLVAAAAADGLSANIHCGVHGVVTELTDGGIWIAAKEG